MKLIVKTLNGKQLPIEIEPETSIGQIKEKIEQDHQLKADSLKLIAYGKVLQSDDQKASEYNLKEGDFIVAMVQKAKPAPKPKKEEKKEEEKPPAATSQPAATSSAGASASAAPSQPAGAQPAGQPAAATSAATASTAQLPPEVESAVSELMAISGKPRDLCIQALMAANNIPDVAFEFLMSGNIPEAPADDGGDADMYGDEGDDMGAGAGGGGLAQYNLSPETLQAIQALSSNPSFPMIRQRMLQDPNFSQQFMAQLQQTQPQIFNAIQQNPGILMSLILGHDPMQGLGPGGGAGGAAGPGGAGGAGAGRARPPPGSIQVTPEEMASIDRLVGLGFSKARAAEAFFACDKNEEMAANFLFENGIEDEEAQMQAAMQASAQQPASANAGSAGEANPANSSEANPASSNEANPAANNNDNAEAEKKDDEKKDGEGGDGGAAGGGDGSSLA